MSFSFQKVSSIFVLLSQGKRRDYRSLGWPSPDECLKLRRVELTTVASTWLAVSAKNIEWVSWMWTLSKLFTQSKTWSSVCVNWRFYVSKKELPGFLRSLKASCGISSIRLAKKSASANERSTSSCFLSYSNEILPGSGQFTFTRELSNDYCVLLTNLTCFMTFVALQNTLILPHSCRNQPWSPFVTQTSQPVCILWTTCKVSLVGPACITLEKVNWKRYARAEGCHTKMAIAWQIQDAFSSVPRLQRWLSVSECLDKTVRTVQCEILPECFPSHLQSGLREILKHH